MFGRSTQYDAKVSENDLYMPGVSLIIGEKSVAKGRSIALVIWLKPNIIDTIQFSASAACISGAADSFQRDLLVKVRVLDIAQCHGWSTCRPNVSYVIHVHVCSIVSWSGTLLIPMLKWSILHLEYVML